MSTRSLLAAAALGGTLVAPRQLSAQTSDSVPETRGHRSSWEFLVPGGAVVPTGAQRAALGRANLTAVQLSRVVGPALAVTATVGWARSRDVASADAPKVDVFTYDLGAEARAPRVAVGRGLTLAPFAGVGAGARSYDYRSLDLDATHVVAAYGAVGGELGLRRLRLRLEARDYLTGFRPLRGGGTTTARNDVVVMAGLRYVRRGG
ncbi:hypothetical protein [Roseisolibacter sp. H3M3-2]|uniref:hypothetical protein n=1 Tax=Roseisolibacter sp. H3M3-2 TaxID=3031323 RepID=UPI0023DC4563|nr:hypothetical protein [Roseisolibacter sp. H3M3-2]MDF1502122.1 hypothetical protein [Roseisolibacter sp. H3M3-2]